ncbi:MAG: pyrroline-5-carboxylate reductase [Xanthomonadaceae bacterium]|nr:pyrroline-5-carboxylate reductase [Xanthomonadaceae bacterium]
MDSGQPLESVTLAFIGGGNMARCLIGGALAAGVPAARIRVGEPDPVQRERLEEAYGVACAEDNRAAVAGADVVVLAVKPQAAAQAVKPLAGALTDSATVVSIMAGIPLRTLRGWLGEGPPLIRAMPNTPALIQMGITTLYADPSVADTARAHVAALLATSGEVRWVDDEAALDAVTALSGSGPAYAFLVIEALAAAGVEAGLEAELARELAIHTLRGAAEMALTTGTDPAVLRRQVTSPGGTTAAALAVLEQADLRGAFAGAVAAGTARSRALAEESGRE